MRAGSVAARYGPRAYGHRQSLFTVLPSHARSPFSLSVGKQLPGTPGTVSSLKEHQGSSLSHTPPPGSTKPPPHTIHTPGHDPAS